MPDHLLPPEIAPGYEDWLAAFWELCTDRQNGMAAGPIPAASIDRHTAGWPDHEAAAFRTCLRAMDAVMLKSNRDEPDMTETDNPARDAFRAANRKPPTNGQ